MDQALSPLRKERESKSRKWEKNMNDLEMYREQLALCDDKVIDALVERNAIVEKNTECRSCSPSRKKSKSGGWRKN